MDLGHTRLKQRQRLEPTQRRIRHIQCILARNLTFTQNANQRTLTSVLLHPQAPQYQNDSHPGNSIVSSNSYYSNAYQPHQNLHYNRSITPSLELPSGASSPTRSYFRSPWRTYYQGVQKVKGPGSDAGSVSASESGRASSVIREPIARLSAGLKATVFSSGYSAESGYTSESGSTMGEAPSSSRSKALYRASADLSVPRAGSMEGHRQQLQQLQQGEDQSSSGRRSREWSSVPSTPPPPTTSNRDRYLSPGNDLASRTAKDSRNQSNSSTSIRDQSAHSDADANISCRLPPFLTSKSKIPILLDTYFTLHDPINDEVIYTSETAIGSNNPKYNPLEDHLFTDQTKRRLSNVITRIWAGYSGSDYYLLLEWRVDLCCLRFIGRELRDLPTSLPNNTILYGFDNGFYTAPDDDDMVVHPHLSLTEPIATLPGGGVSPSYTYESVMRLNNLHECIADTKKSRDEIKHNIELALNKENAPMIMQKRRGECTERLWHLQRQVGHELNVLEQARDKAKALRQEHAARRKALAESRERGQTQEMYLEENMLNLAKNKESLFHVLKEYSTKRTELIATLFTIFPITESERDPSVLRICNIPLPNSVYIGMDEEAVAIALGFTTQLVTMLAHYLSVPLRYPLTPMGSRAFVLDPVSLLVGPKEFPLFGKSQERHRFEYGVFLLNKDIEQLMNSQGLQFMDLRQTLPNLRYLMETILTSSPIQSMVYRSKFISRTNQSRHEQERLNDLFVISLEQREFDHILRPESEYSSSDGYKDQGIGGAGKRPVEKSPSTSRPNNSERSALVREYDPIEGDYMLVLDNASTKSPRSRNETSDSDVSTVERAGGPLISVLSPRGGHHRVSSGLRQGYASSVSLSGTEDEDRQSVDDPAFRDWASEAVVNVAGSEQADTTLEEPDSLGASEDLSTPLGSNISQGFIRSCDNHVASSSNDAGSGQSRESTSDEHGGSTAANTTLYDSPRLLNNATVPICTKLITGGSVMSHDSKGTDVDGTIHTQSVSRSRPPSPAMTSATPSKEHSRVHTVESSQKARRISSISQRQQKETCQEDEVPDDDELSLHGTISLVSPDSATMNSNQRGRRVSDKFKSVSSGEDQTASKEMILRHGQPSPATTPGSGILEATT